MEVITTIDYIPKGSYCYEPIGFTDGVYQIKPCPYWASNPDKYEQESGYCTKYDIKDWEDGTLLWDMVKECGNE